MATGNLASVLSNVEEIRLGVIGRRTGRKRTRLSPSRGRLEHGVVQERARAPGHHVGRQGYPMDGTGETDHQPCQGPRRGQALPSQARRGGREEVLLEVRRRGRGLAPSGTTCASFTSKKSRPPLKPRGGLPVSALRTAPPRKRR